MKYLKLFENFLLSDNILYKSVNLSVLPKILTEGIKLRENNLIGFRAHKTSKQYKYSSSFTRSNYYFYVEPGQNIQIPQIRLVLDRNKLKSKYIINPTNYHSKEGSQLSNRYESEERVFSDVPTTIPPTFILRIEVSKDLYDQVLLMENPYNIDIKVNKFLRIRTRSNVMSTKKVYSN